MSRSPLSHDQLVSITAVSLLVGGTASGKVLAKLEESGTDTSFEGAHRGQADSILAHIAAFNSEIREHQDHWRAAGVDSEDVVRHLRELTLPESQRLIEDVTIRIISLGKHLFESAGDAELGGGFRPLVEQICWLR